MFLNVKMEKSIARVVYFCSKMFGVKQKRLNVLFESRVRWKKIEIICDSKHALACEYELLLSSQRKRGKNKEHH